MSHSMGSEYSLSWAELIHFLVLTPITLTYILTIYNTIIICLILVIKSGTKYLDISMLHYYPSVFKTYVLYIYAFKFPLYILMIDLKLLILLGIR